MELTWHTGNQGDRVTLHIDWINSNLVHRQDKIELAIGEQDKPRTLYITINDMLVGKIEHWG